MRSTMRQIIDSKANRVRSEKPSKSWDVTGKTSYSAQIRNAMPSMNPALVNSIRQMKRFKGLYAEPNKQDSSKSKHNKAHHNKKETQNPKHKIRNPGRSKAALIGKNWSRSENFSEKNVESVTHQEEKGLHPSKFSDTRTRPLTTTEKGGKPSGAGIWEVSHPLHLPDPAVTNVFPSSELGFPSEPDHRILHQQFANVPVNSEPRGNENDFQYFSRDLDPMIILPNTQQQNNSVYRYLPLQAILPEPHYPGPVQLNGIDNMKLSGQPTYSALEGTQRTRTNPGEQYYRGKEGTQMPPAGYSLEEISSTQERAQPFTNQGGIQGFPDPHYDLYSNVYPIESPPEFLCCGMSWKNDNVSFVAHLYEIHNMSQECGNLFCSLLSVSRSKESQNLCRILLNQFEKDYRKLRINAEEYITKVITQIGSLQNQITRLKSTAAALTKDLKNSSMKIDQISEEKDKLENKNSRLTQEISFQEQQREQNKHDIVTVQEQNIQLQDETRKLLDLNSDLMRRIRNSDEIKVELERELNMRMENEKQNKQQVLKLREHISSMEQKLELSSKEHELMIKMKNEKECELRELETRIRKLEDENRNLYKEKEFLIKERIEKENMYTEKNEKVERLGEENRKMLQENLRFREEARIYRTENEAKEEQIRNLQEESDSQLNELLVCRNKHDESRMEIEKVKSENKVIIENLERQVLENQRKVQVLQETYEREKQMFREEKNKFQYIKTVLNSQNFQFRIYRTIEAVIPN
ncbi:uncharacterized protein LOC111698275 isoform X2 [Eurytemora carolleeae]|uniref:uncharacterized protein LOC111698275 isoform X2 n=1 Tax=Eurytemora carolleeae TaxID=1294199 RepID=UPI000C75B8CA|nr:uncharacterized protein LOC111698275 isoform X2 [Eurytemora carolleeae]|eukprot:XP_023324340.1 uncharacterized protein LOC111698275 isoform X2 [Eurytemora affinis]